MPRGMRKRRRKAPLMISCQELSGRFDRRFGLRLGERVGEGNPALDVIVLTVPPVLEGPLPGDPPLPGLHRIGLHGIVVVHEPTGTAIPAVGESAAPEGRRFLRKRRERLREDQLVRVLLRRFVVGGRLEVIQGDLARIDRLRRLGELRRRGDGRGDERASAPAGRSAHGAGTAAAASASVAAAPRSGGSG
jgi:hypothetical protein